MRSPRGYPQYPWGDNEKEYFGTDDDIALYFDGTYFRMDSSVHEMAIKLSTAGSTWLSGGTAATDDLILTASNARAWLAGGVTGVCFYGNDTIEFDHPTGKHIAVLSGSSVDYHRIGYSITSFHLSTVATGNNTKISWGTQTTSGNVVGLELDASTNLTMGTNLGATGLKINVRAPNGAGKSVGIDLSSLAVDFPVLKVVADAITTAGTLSGQIAIDIGGTVYYLEYFTHGS